VISRRVAFQPENCSPWDAMPEDPTPDEIRQACQEIQASWSEQERRYRAAVCRPRESDRRVTSGYISRA
jgi:hypothetical protein